MKKKVKPESVAVVEVSTPVADNVMSYAADGRLTGTNLRLDLACGDNKREGFIGIDAFQTASTNVVFDLLATNPWPIEDGVAEILHCSHFFEHVPGMQRPAFMDECFRILKPGGQLVVITPYWSSARSIQDFTHAWPPVCESSFLYFNKLWREQNKLTHGHYNVKSDFDFGYGFSLDPDTAVRSQEVQPFWVKHYLNSCMDIHVTLTKTKR